MEPVTEQHDSTPLELAEQALHQVSDYGALILNSLYLIIAGTVLIFLVQKLVARFLYPHIKNKRIIKVAFGTLYTLVLVIILLLALRQIGFDVGLIGRLALVGVLIGAVVVFFLLPFLPRLPFVPGHMVNINGTLGIVDAISTFHTTIRKFDGSMVFMPNAVVMASNITNVHDTPSRRIDMEFSVNPDSDLAKAKAFLIDIAATDTRVLSEPAPPVIFITNADANAVHLSMYCWVLNADWLATRSDLWQGVMEQLKTQSDITLALPEQTIHMAQAGAVSATPGI
jgi:small conductance mechanosensitive channel